MECPEKLSELGGLSELLVPELTDLYCANVMNICHSLPC